MIFHPWGFFWNEIFSLCLAYRKAYQKYCLLLVVQVWYYSIIAKTVDMDIDSSSTKVSC